MTADGIVIGSGGSANANAPTVASSSTCCATNGGCCDRDNSIINSSASNARRGAHSCHHHDHHHHHHHHSHHRSSQWGRRPRLSSAGAAASSGGVRDTEDLTTTSEGGGGKGANGAPPAEEPWGYSLDQWLCVQPRWTRKSYRYPFVNAVKSSLDAMRCLLEYRCSQIALFDFDRKVPVAMASLPLLLTYLVQNLRGTFACFDWAVRSRLRLGVSRVQTFPVGGPLRKLMAVMLENDWSAVPVVDADDDTEEGESRGPILGCFTRAHFLQIAARCTQETTTLDLDLPTRVYWPVPLAFSVPASEQHASAAASTGGGPPPCCVLEPDLTLREVISKVLFSAERRVIFLKDGKEPDHLITISDVCRALIGPDR
eukprot:GHVU01078245.1.p1 GENE.GHVU01078245.1~~GHVU01078245.1.p1  ORF type:complete len:419 (-),score=68.13 GHVU01078245.1:89-1201(-)